MEENELEEIVFKFFILGDSNVGKTSIIFKYLNIDKEKVNHSIGLELFKKELSKNENSKIIFKIWDCSGQKRFRDVAATYCKSKDGAFIVYDITNRKSFESIDELANLVRKNNSQTSPIVLIGNKTDLKDERKISLKSGADLAKENGFIFMESSCKDNYNVSDAFTTLIEMTNSELIKTNNRKNFKLKDTTNNTKEKENKKCC